MVTRPGRAALVLAVAVALGAACGPAAASEPHSRVGVASPAPAVAAGAFPGQLESVSGLSPGRAWAAGSYCTTSSCAVQDTLILHWNGAAWSKVASPSPGVTNLIFGVTAISAADAWAAGNYCTTDTCTLQPGLMLHWNGAAWSRVTIPQPGPVTVLSGVTATSATSVWAAGYYCTASSCTLQHPLILHWNGTAWSKVTIPVPGAVSNLNGVATESATSVWAAGFYCARSACGAERTLILHWNGTAWAKVPSPNVSSAFASIVQGVAATAPSQAWAAGYSCASGASGACQPLMLRWNGTAWSKAAIPSPRSARTMLGGVIATSSADAWAVGEYCTTPVCTGIGAADDTLILHWNGTTWSKAASPTPGPGFNNLNAVSADSPADAWAVGSYCTTSSCTAQDPLILHWNGRAWSKTPA
jgi:hypothetical protein